MASLDFYFQTWSPPSKTALTVAKILGVPLNLKLVDFAKGENRTAEYLARNPNHTVPVLVNPQTGFSVFESAAISTYLVNKFAPGHSLYPADPEKRAKVDEALHFFSSSFQATAAAILGPLFFQQKAPPADLMAVMKEKISVITTMIGNKKFLTGDTITIPDIALAYYVPGLKFIGDEFETPELVQFLERVKAASPEFKEISEKYAQ